VKIQIFDPKNFEQDSSIVICYGKTLVSAKQMPIIIEA